MPLIKKFLDQEGLTVFSRQLNNYPDNTVLTAVIEGMQDALEEKQDASTAVTGVSYDAISKKIQYIVNGIAYDVVGVSTLKTDLNLNKNDVGLSSVDNTSDLDKCVSTATQTALNAKLGTDLKGAAGGLAELDGSGKVPLSQLPNSLDDVLAYTTTLDFPATGATNTLYIETSTDKVYRWDGAQYVQLSSSVQLGTTSNDAYRGDYGAAAYAHGVTNKGSAFTSGLYKITTNSEGHVTAAANVLKEDITGLGIPAQDTTYTMDGTYDAITNKVATLSSISAALTALGSTVTGSPSAAKTLTAFEQVNGNVAATFGDIEIEASQVSDAGAAILKNVDIQIAADQNNSYGVNLPTSTAVVNYINSIKATANGIPTLDANGKVPASQLPSYVDDVEEYFSIASFPNIGEEDKIYVDNDTGITYRWSGTNYVEISSSLALGETEHTAYRGDRGAQAYTHAVTNKGIGANSGFYKITTNNEGHVTAVTNVAASDITGLGVAASNIIKIGPRSFINETSAASTITATINSSSATFPITGDHEIIGSYYSDMTVFSGNVSAETTTGSVTINVPLKAGRSVDVTLYLGIPQ